MLLPPFDSFDKTNFDLQDSDLLRKHIGRGVRAKQLLHFTGNGGIRKRSFAGSEKRGEVVGSYVTEASHEPLMGAKITILFTAPPECNAPE